jgi:cytochrome c556
MRNLAPGLPFRPDPWVEVRMKNILLSVVSAVALVAVAACNQEEQASAPPANVQSPAPTTSAAAPVDAAQVMHDRHENYERMGRAMKGISRELKSEAPAAAEIQQHSATIAGFAPQVPSWFPAGTGPEAGRTRAKAEIWSDPQGFAAAVQRFQQAAAQFDSAARSGDVAAIRAAMPALGSSCSNCHDKYRAPERD